MCSLPCDIWASVLKYSDVASYASLQLTSTSIRAAVRDAADNDKAIWDVWGLERIQRRLNTLCDKDKRVVGIKNEDLLAADFSRATVEAAVARHSGRTPLIAEPKAMWVASEQLVDCLDLCLTEVPRPPNSRFPARFDPIAKYLLDERVLELVDNICKCVRLHPSDEMFMWQLAAMCGHAELVFCLLSRGLLRPDELCKNVSLVQLAAASKSLDLFRIVLDWGADITFDPESEDLCILHFCTTAAMVDLIMEHLPRAALDQAPMWDVHTPLLGSRNPEVLRALCRHGCDVNHRSLGGWTAANIFYEENKRDLFEAAVECGVPFEPHAPFDNGETCTCCMNQRTLLHGVVAYPHLVRELVEVYHADVLAVNSYGRLPMHEAMEFLTEQFDTDKADGARQSLDYLMQVTPRPFPKVSTTTIWQNIFTGGARDDEALLDLALELNFDVNEMLSRFLGSVLCYALSHSRSTKIPMKLLDHGADPFFAHQGVTIMERILASTDKTFAVKRCDLFNELASKRKDIIAKITPSTWQRVILHHSNSSINDVMQPVVLDMISSDPSIIEMIATMPDVTDDACVSGSKEPFLLRLVQCSRVSFVVSVLDALTASTDLKPPFRLADVRDSVGRPLLHYVRSAQMCSELMSRYGCAFGTFDPSRDPHWFVEVGGIALLRFVLEEAWPDALPSFDPCKVNADGNTVMHLLLRYEERIVFDDDMNRFLNDMVVPRLNTGDVARLEAEGQTLLNVFLGSPRGERFVRAVATLVEALGCDVITDIVFPDGSKCCPALRAVEAFSSKGKRQGRTTPDSTLHAILRNASQQYRARGVSYPTEYVCALFAATDVSIIRDVLLPSPPLPPSSFSSLTFTTEQAQKLMCRVRASAEHRTVFCDVMQRYDSLSRTVVHALDPKDVFDVALHRETEILEKVLLRANREHVVSLRAPSASSNVGIMEYVVANQKCRTRSTRLYNAVYRMILHAMREEGDIVGATCAVTACMSSSRLPKSVQDYLVAELLKICSPTAKSE
eukprot:PhM_4_TR8010/c0_g1_i1/m.45150